MSDDAHIPIKDEPCPKCGGDVILGFGLMGGGFGAYEFCENDACDYFLKPSVDTENC